MNPARPTRVEFTLALEAALEALARARFAAKSGAKSLLVDVGADEWQGSLIAVRSEYAVAEVLGIAPPKGWPLTIWDAGTDLILPDGATVQVKYSAHPAGRFALPFYENALRADFGVLVVMAPRLGEWDLAAVTVVGAIDRATFAARASRVELSKGEQLMVDQSELGSIYDLVPR